MKIIGGDENPANGTIYLNEESEIKTIIDEVTGAELQAGSIKIHKYEKNNKDYAWAKAKLDKGRE